MGTYSDIHIYSGVFTGGGLEFRPLAEPKTKMYRFFSWYFSRIFFFYK